VTADPLVIDLKGIGRRRNVYLSAADRILWAEAEKLAEPQSMSGLVVALLRKFVEQRQASDERIVVEVTDADGNRVRKGFRGRMLVKNFAGRLNGAQGARGGLALWAVETDGQVRFFDTYASWEDLLEKDSQEEEGWGEGFLSAISSALGEAYVEDIEL
jgi:hypothetical protein